MSHCDPISDMLTRIRNAVGVEYKEVTVKASKVCEGIAKVLRDQGYITGFDRINNGSFDVLRIELKYGPYGEQILRELHRKSKPSCRTYCKVEDIPYVLGGMGIAILSTSQGVLSDQECRERNIGGELLCTIS